MTSLTLGLIAALCWGLHDITIRYLSKSVPLLAALLFVLLVGATFQIGVLLALQDGIALPARAFWLSIAAGVAFLVASLGLYFAFERGPVRLVAPAIASYPILSMIFAAWFGASITALDALAVGLIIAGVSAVAYFSDDSDARYPPMGPTLVLSLISAAGFACTFKLGQLAAVSGGEIATTLVARLTALLLLGIIILAARQPKYPGTRALLPLGVMGLLDGVALLSVISAASLPRPEFAAVAASTFGMLTIVLAWAFLKERMRVVQWLGCLLAFSGIAYLAL
ncbi:EamA family transporter [Primorskyibacter sp. S187A]|uniref:EamA family transporter n=1 Tax=Primorskyibacter sp. S187A TaxID=3415130 RepID=UPI003C7B95C5